MIRALSALVAALILGAGLWVGAKGAGPVPPLGPLLDPANGIWRVAATAELPRDARATIPELHARARVVYDDRAVPHIFATTDEDAERALGYVVARDRLFQLELQARAGAGTLTELVGPAALEEDRNTRRLGLGAAVAWKLAALERHPKEMAALSAFADGANAYIDGLAPRDFPIEYKLLGRTPRRWEPEHAIALFDRMAYTLTYNDEELTHAAAAARVGRAAADALFPLDQAIQEPIQPSSRPEPRVIRHVLPPPGKPDSSAIAFALAPARPRGDELVIGSNNWAVSPRRTRGGHALLAGDPHLDLTLPSIWYEAHLVVPGSLDVYGVTIPGASSIIIGFNRDIAWSLTNTEADYLDRYVETVDDAEHPTRYRVDGAWRPLTPRVEVYRAPSGATIATDTVLWTHRGPMRRLAARWISMRWTALDSTTNVGVFDRAQHARSAADWLAITASYPGPGQNMLVADRAGSIAIRSTAEYPARRHGMRGDWLFDGSTSASDWTGYLPVTSYPQSVDPARGYLSSNNQQPVDPSEHPPYYGGQWFPPWRAIRINELMRTNAIVTPDDMRRWQTDPRSARAEFFVPAFLAAAGDLGVSRDTTVTQAAKYLAQWDRSYGVDNQRAILFEFAMAELVDRTWDELNAGPSGPPRLIPDGGVMLDLMQQPKSPWWDDRRTPGIVETRDDILTASLAAAYTRVLRELGPPDDGGWRWGKNRHMRIMHLLGIPAFSVMNVPNQGGPSTLSPMGVSGTEGASWRMVVELGPDVHAWGTYPGGQSGNPASTRYANHIAQWSAGTLDSLRFPRRESELDRDRVTSVLTLTPRDP